MNNIILFEDHKFWQFSPLTVLRPVYELRCGINLLKEKIARQYQDSSLNLFCRNEIAKITTVKNNVDVNQKNINCGLLLNGRIISNNLHSLIPIDGDDVIYKNGDDIVAVRFSNSKQLLELFDNQNLLDITNNTFPIVETEVDLVQFPWDLVYKNGNEIRNDFNWYFKNIEPEIFGKVYNGVHLLNEKQINIGQNSTIKPGVVLDAENGPILIGNNVTIMPNSVIVGPVFIGDNSVIKTGAKIYEDTSIGEVCKVGGEVECSIFQSYSNKQHDGFLGHSYLGSWVNLGADTNNSDLKNNYSNVSVQIEGKIFDTGSNIFGLIMGDHSKTAISTRFNTGTVVGICSNIFGSGFPPKVIPSFSWGGFDSKMVHKIDKAIETAKIVMNRRGINLSIAEIELFTSIYQNRNSKNLHSK